MVYLRFTTDSKDRRVPQIFVQKRIEEEDQRIDEKIAEKEPVLVVKFDRKIDKPVLTESRENLFNLTFPGRLPLFANDELAYYAKDMARLRGNTIFVNPIYEEPLTELFRLLGCKHEIKPSDLLSDGGFTIDSVGPDGKKLEWINKEQIDWARDEKKWQRWLKKEILKNKWIRKLRDGGEKRTLKADFFSEVEDLKKELGEKDLRSATMPFGMWEDIEDELQRNENSRKDAELKEGIYKKMLESGNDKEIEMVDEHVSNTRGETAFIPNVVCHIDIPFAMIKEPCEVGDKGYKGVLFYIENLIEGAENPLYTGRWKVKKEALEGVKKQAERDGLYVKELSLKDYKLPTGLIFMLNFHHKRMPDGRVEIRGSDFTREFADFLKETWKGKVRITVGKVHELKPGVEFRRENLLYKSRRGGGFKCARIDMGNIDFDALKDNIGSYVKKTRLREKI